jgi:hypothetical protein
VPPERADQADPDAETARAAGNPLRKGSKAGPPRSTQKREAKASRDNRAAPAPATPAKPLNDAVIID